MHHSNAANEKQIKESELTNKKLRERELDDLREVIESPVGRRLVWRLLSHCQVFSSVHHQSGSQVYYNVGRQDVGHFILSEITQARSSGLIEMMMENKGD